MHDGPGGQLVVVVVDDSEGEWETEEELESYDAILYGS